MGRLSVLIIGARNLYDSEARVKVDPYVKLKYGKNTFKTMAAGNTANPKWNESFVFQVAEENVAELDLEVWNRNLLSDISFLGKCVLSTNRLIGVHERTGWYLLRRGQTNAEIHLALFADFVTGNGNRDNVAAVSQNSAISTATEHLRSVHKPALTAAASILRCMRPGCPFKPHPQHGSGFCCLNCPSGRPHGLSCLGQPAPLD